MGTKKQPLFLAAFFSVLLFLILIIWLLSWSMCLGQDTIPTDTIGSGSGTEGNSITVLMMVAIVAVYELLARLYPTVKDYSLLNKLILFINNYLPNIKIDEATGKKTGIHPIDKK